MDEMRQPLTDLIMCSDNVAIVTEVSPKILKKKKFCRNLLVLDETALQDVMI